jgi:tRNA(fMet)-specific endonuclease VapC
MTYLLDTDVCVAWLRGIEGVEGQILARGAEQVCISVVTHAELLYGAMRSSRVEENLARVKSFVRLQRVIGLSDAVLEEFAREKARLRGEGQLCLTSTS